MGNKDLIINEGISFLLESNCHVKGDKGSLWVLPDIYDEEFQIDKGVHDPPYYYESPGARKIIGPIDYKVAEKIYEGLVAAFKDYGFHVYDGLVVDD